MARLEEKHPPKEAIRAFLTEIIERSLKDPDCKGCLLVNSALDVAPHDAGVGKAVADYLDEIRDFFRRNIEAARRAGTVPKGIDADSVSGHMLGVLMGIRAMARVKPERKLLESVARPEATSARSLLATISNEPMFPPRRMRFGVTGRAPRAAVTIPR